MVRLAEVGAAFWAAGCATLPAVGSEGPITLPLPLALAGTCLCDAA